MRNGVYVGFVDSRMTRATYRKREAIEWAKRHPGSEVRGMPRHQWRDSGPYGWDAPTFKLCSELVYAHPRLVADGAD